MAHGTYSHLGQLDTIKLKQPLSCRTAFSMVNPLATGLAADVLCPGEHEEAVNSALHGCDLALDFSASVAVSRHLAGLDTKARHISAFVTPKGDGLVVLAEDPTRAVRLDWLEMLHYRAVLNEPSLFDSLQSADTHLRYGNGCRDVTSRLAQDDLGVWAGVASKEIRKLSRSENAAIRIFQAAGDGSVQVIQPVTSPPNKLRLNDWTLVFDRWLLAKLAAYRKRKLPNETGGVLLGAFDTHAKTCFIIDALPSPPDSTEWPTTYIRGCEGLREKVEQVKTRLLGQAAYVGEWHSHPRAASVRPSDDDRKAYGWLVGHMHADALPGIMLIVGDRYRYGLVSNTPE